MTCKQLKCGIFRGIPLTVFRTLVEKKTELKTHFMHLQAFMICKLADFSYKSKPSVCKKYLACDWAARM